MVSGISGNAHTLVHLKFYAQLSFILTIKYLDVTVMGAILENTIHVLEHIFDRLKR